MRRSLPFLLLLLAACHSRITYPPGGYAYPEHVTGKDTELYYYLLKDKESRRDSMQDAKNYEDWRAIGEPNLSLRPMQTDVFRFTYSEVLRQILYIIRMTPTEMTVRICTPNKEYSMLPDTSRLDTLERRLIRILDRHYPLDEKNPLLPTPRQHYLDSMGRRYPQLYNPDYYITIRNKEFPHDKPWYSFTSKTIKLNPSDFEHLVSIINSSGYWHLPYELPCQFPPMDGWGYSLEANTARQYNYVSAGSCGDATVRPFDSACQELVRYAGLQEKIHLVSDWKADTTRKPFVIEDVQLEDVKEPKPKKPKHHHPIKKPHPN